METHQCGFMSAVLERFEPYHKETVRFKIFSFRNPDLGQRKREVFVPQLPSVKKGWDPWGRGQDHLQKSFVF